MKYRVIKGQPVSKGIVLGTVRYIEQAGFKIDTELLDQSQLQHEFIKLDKAVDKTMEEVHMLEAGMKKNIKDQCSFVFDIYRSVLEDKIFIDEIKELIINKRLHAEHAAYLNFNNCMKNIEDSGNDYLLQRTSDFNDIRDRLIKNIIGRGEKSIPKIKDNEIFLVREMTPMLAAAVCKRRSVGVAALDGASFFSHSAIILRGLGIPTLNNIDYGALEDLDGKTAILDAVKGLLLLNPDAGELEGYWSSIEKLPSECNTSITKGQGKLTYTKDGKQIGIYANAGSIEECKASNEKGMDGIGLVRTEILFSEWEDTPDEEQQFKSYSEIFKEVPGKTVVIRTFDIGTDKFFGKSAFESKYAAGMEKGIARSLIMRKEFKSQLRAIIRAAEDSNYCISFPMVGSADEIKEAKAVIELIYSELQSDASLPMVKPKLNAVIETMSGVRNIDKILDEVDMISIGTNDLLYQTIGYDRNEYKIEDWEYLHPELLGIVKECICAANNKGKAVSVCGEMSADPLAAVILTGFGVTSLSIPPLKCDEIRKIIEEISFIDAKNISGIALKCDNAYEVKCLLEEWFKKKVL